MLDSSSIKKIAIFSLIMIIIDYFWINNVMSKMYKPFLKAMNIEINMRLAFAIVAYLLMVCGYIFFINNTKDEYKNSILLGGIIFGVYGFTVGALFKGYSLQLALTETLWGALLYSMTTFLTNKLY